MCGISGVILRAGEKVLPDQLHKMAACMIRRGPDAEGVFNFENIGFAHRRLKVIDLNEAANQPMQSLDQKVVIVFNGEIYNFLELREELISQYGRKFRTQSDTEVLLQAYEVWGPDAFKKFNGMFACGILDLRDNRKKVFLVRDRFGIKPLFYSHSAGRLSFASELKPLMTLDWFNRAIDYDALYYFLKFSHIPYPYSIFKEVKQLTPGHYLSYENGKLSEFCYRDMHDKSTVPPQQQQRSEEEWLTELEITLKRVLSRQLVSDVPVGVFLSGGIDSSLLTLMSTEILGKKLDTFTISYDEQEFDEGPYANEVARFAGAKPNEIKVSSRDLLEVVHDLPLYFDQPFADPTLFSSLILARETKKSVSVVLSGDGADELFAAYPYQEALRRLRFFKDLPVSLRSTTAELLRLGNPFISSRQRQQLSKLRDILHFKSEAQLIYSFIGNIGPLRWDRIPRLLKNYSAPANQLMDQALEKIKSCSWSEKIEDTFLRTFLVDTVLAKTDRSGMAFGLEARVPFLDDEMVSFCSEIPENLKSRTRSSKYLLRQLLKKKLPGNLSSRKKQGFSIPLRDWLKSDLKIMLLDYLNFERLQREGFFDPEEVQKLIREFEAGEANHSHLIFSLLSFQLWQEHYL